MSKHGDKELILAYAFDAAGLPLPNAIDGPEYRIEWVKEVATYFESYTRVTYAEDLMLTRERQLLNLLIFGQRRLQVG